MGTAEKERQERERLRIERAKMRREEQEKLQALLQEVDNWNKSEQIRAYVEAVKEWAANNNNELDQCSDMNEWIEWASQQANMLDPLTETPQVIFDD